IPFWKPALCEEQLQFGRLFHHWRLLGTDRCGICQSTHEQKSLAPRAFCPLAGMRSGDRGLSVPELEFSRNHGIDYFLNFGKTIHLELLVIIIIARKVSKPVFFLC